jgi:hypothetical protein
MRDRSCRLAWVLAACATLLSAMPAAAQDFPSGGEFRLDVNPMRGSKRIPGLEINGGTATFDLWCNSVQAQLVVAADTITIITGPLPERQCPPDRARGDEDLVAALNAVTNWRRDGDFLVLTGARTLRFRQNTN